MKNKLIEQVVEKWSDEYTDLSENSHVAQIEKMAYLNASKRMYELMLEACYTPLVEDLFETELGKLK